MHAWQTFFGTLVFGSALVGCGGATSTMTPGAMPEGGTFRGVWSSPELGDVQLCETDGRVVGTYVGDYRGLIQGNADGDLLVFEWREDHGSVMGRPVTQSGHGFVRISLGGDGGFTLTGERGVGEAQQGQGGWHAAPVQDRQPTGCYDALRM
jgi:hypothetical protein